MHKASRRYIYVQINFLLQRNFLGHNFTSSVAFHWNKTSAPTYFTNSPIDAAFSKSLRKIEAFVSA